MPSKRTAAVAVANNGKFYVIGGSDEVGVSVATNEVYDLATNRWSTARPMLTARNHPAGGVVNGKVYVIGGRLTAANVANMISSATDIVEEYDPATDKWKSMTKMPYLTSGQGWTTYQNKIYVAGGELRDAHLDATFRDVVVFDPAANEGYFIGVSNLAFSRLDVESNESQPAHTLPGQLIGLRHVGVVTVPHHVGQVQQLGVAGLGSHVHQ